jgi:hypothetical protein
MAMKIYDSKKEMEIPCAFGGTAWFRSDTMEMMGSSPKQLAFYLFVNNLYVTDMGNLHPDFHDDMPQSEFDLEIKQ